MDRIQIRIYELISPSCHLFSIKDYQSMDFFYQAVLIAKIG
jgi:hypothetical protein